VTSRVRVATRLVVTVQWRARFPQVYLGVAIFTIIGVRTLIPPEIVPLALPAFLFGEPGSMGIMMVAAHRYMERGDRSVVALAVTPLTSREYVSALIFGSAIVPTLATAVVQAGVQGMDFRVALVLPPLYLIAVVSGSIGLLLSTLFSEFTRFILGSIPSIMVYSLPLLSLFGLAPWWALMWLPSAPALYIFTALARGDVDPLAYLGALALLAMFAGLAWMAAIARYTAKVRGEIEFA